MRIKIAQNLKKTREFLGSNGKIKKEIENKNYENLSELSGTGEKEENTNDGQN